MTPRERLAESDADILGWLGMLAPTNRQRMDIIRDLLKNAAKDRMSEEDRLACLRAKYLIDQHRVPECAPARILAVDRNELETEH